MNVFTGGFYIYYDKGFGKMENGLKLARANATNALYSGRKNSSLEILLSLD